jgi:hypothetical protein
MKLERLTVPVLSYKGTEVLQPGLLDKVNLYLEV